MLKTDLKSGVITALGAMSGTSLDGVDAAIIQTDGITISGFGPSAYRPYTEGEQAVLRGALGQWQDADLDDVAELIETAHAQVLIGFDGVDVVGFHGQTLAHDPDNGRTHQLGDGQILADVLEVPVVWDFRTADVMVGGQGAPLAPFYHFALAKYIGATAPVAFLNLGGVGNLTWVDPSKSSVEQDGAVLAFDTGPANAPINDLMMDWFGFSHDEGGQTALAGTVDQGIVAGFLKHPYFAKMPPKSLDRDTFEGLAASVDHLSAADAAATLVEVCAQSVAASLTHCPTRPERLLVCGGGRKNPAIMEAIHRACQTRVIPVEDVDLDGDMLEAQAFAYLAVRVARGLSTSGPSTTGVSAHVGGGTLSHPRD